MTSAARRALGSIFVFLLLVGGHPAHAQEPPSEQSRREAKLHFDLGTAYYNAGKYDLAIGEYQKAYQLHPAPLLLFNLGQASRKKGDRAAAIGYYQEFLQADSASSRSAEARKYIEDLEREQAQALREEAKARFDKATALYDVGRYDEAIAEYEAANRVHPVPDLDFYVAQALRKKGERRRALERYRKYLAAAPEDAKSGEAKRYVDELEGEEHAEREAAAKAKAAANALATKPPVDTPPGPTKRSQWRIWVGIAAAGVAVAGVGGFLHWQTARDFAAYDQAIIDCSQAQGGQARICEPVPSEIAALRTRGQALQTLAFVAYGVGGAGVATGIALLGVTRRRAHRDAQPAPSPSLSLAPFFGPGHAGVVTTLRF